MIDNGEGEKHTKQKSLRVALHRLIRNHQSSSHEVVCLYFDFLEGIDLTRKKENTSRWAAENSGNRSLRELAAFRVFVVITPLAGG
jgi:hypothetical protein